ncbi:hypothetical protein EB093_09460, partial [bacterium]|nr:hypothetical protein [bacterium]
MATRLEVGVLAGELEVDDEGCVRGGGGAVELDVGCGGSSAEADLDTPDGGALEVGVGLVIAGDGAPGGGGVPGETEARSGGRVLDRHDGHGGGG